MTTTTDTLERGGEPIDPFRYEILTHRIWSILEEGRLTLQRVSASPIVSQGGECMSSLYAPDGTMVLACSGHLRFAAATSQAIRALIDWFGESPGFFPGDQIFFNDPYIAGSHTYDQMVIKPLFHGDVLYGWTASSSHTADTGGQLRGGATEIFHEGIRYLGVKIIERGEFREDVYKSIVEQCRDTVYVGLDLRSRIAANNVVAERLDTVIDQFGLDFLLAASDELIADSERRARAKLRSLPDGRWSSRLYSSARDKATDGPVVFPVVCTIDKRGDELSIDLTGSGPQMTNDQNSTLASTLAHVSVALTNFLFWDVPWSDGRMAPVSVVVPDDSVVNCTFPAACGGAPRVGQVIVSALAECLANLLYAAGENADVNATWQGFWYLGGPGRFYGGLNQDGVPVPQGLYDDHGGGLGATPERDGVDTGGHNNIPSGGISDVETIELHYPFLYFARRHTVDGVGYGEQVGGCGSQRLLMVHGSNDLTVDFKPYAGVPQGGFGLHGGFPSGSGGVRAVLEPGPELLSALADGRYPTAAADALDDGTATTWSPAASAKRVSVPEGWLLSDFTQGGGGFGDPLRRPGHLVAADVRRGVLSHRIAGLVFGVVLDEQGEVDAAGTRERRGQLRQDRLTWPALGERPRVDRAGLTRVRRIHDGLDLATTADGTAYTVCHYCAEPIAAAGDNYKLGTRYRTVAMDEVAGRPMPTGVAYLGELQQYACGSCGQLLATTVWVPGVDEAEHWHDIAVDG